MQTLSFCGKHTAVVLPGHCTLSRRQQDCYARWAVSWACRGPHFLLGQMNQDDNADILGSSSVGVRSS